MMSVGGAFIIVLFVGLLLVGFIPTIVAYRKKHRNKLAVGVANFAALFVPLPDDLKWLGLVAWLLCLAFALWKSPDIKVVQGPEGPTGAKGDKGDPGKDAIPMSKAGNITEKEV